VPRGGGINDDGEDGVSSSPTAAASTTTPGVAPGGRRLVRRFRGSIGRSYNSSKTITPGTT
jgi:hypothetical protein